MAVTLEELKARIAQRLDEPTILEVLEIDATDLVECFEDKISERYDRLVGDLFDTSETQTDSEDSL